MYNIRLIWFLFLLLLVTSAAVAQQAEDSPAQPWAGDGCGAAALAIKAEPGDTFTGLFGADWERVWRCNQQTVLRNGVPVSSPDLLVSGTTIRIPADTQLTPGAAARLQSIEQQRIGLLSRLDRLPEASLDAGARTGAEQCRKLLNDKVRFASDIAYAARQTEYLEGLAANPGQHGGTVVRMVPWWVVACALVLIILILLASRKRPPHSTVLEEKQEQARARLAQTCARAGIRYTP